MKRIVIAVDTYFPKKDGVVRFLENIVPRLARRYFITILCPDFNGKERFFDLKNVNEIRFPVDKSKSFAGYNSVEKTGRLREIAIREIRNCDLVFSQDIAYLGRLAISYGKELRKPVVSFVHQIVWEQLEGIFAKRPFRRWFWKKFSKAASRHILMQCSLLFVPSRKTAMALKQQGIEKDKAIVHLGVDIEKFCPPSSKSAAKVRVRLDPKRKIIGYSGRISEEKDLLTLKEAFIAVKEKFPDAMLLLVGDGTEEYAKKIKNSRDDIIVTGFVSNVQDYLKAMDVFVLPSLTETTSLATIEAMACGVPVITTPVGRLEEFVHNGVNGYLFPKGNEILLAKRIELLLSSEEKGQSMGKNARQSVLKLSWEYTIRQMSELFEKLTLQT